MAAVQVVVASVYYNTVRAPQRVLFEQFQAQAEWPQRHREQICVKLLSQMLHLPVLHVLSQLCSQGLAVLPQSCSLFSPLGDGHAVLPALLAVVISGSCWGGVLQSFRQPGQNGLWVLACRALQVLLSQALKRKSTWSGSMEQR
ncbi:hypothetical protein AAFF_G00273880 [Aldrovandia affinis]|uniref:Uncharacterized protein n=1 Tax=Aldrovandia affinis TaxID=143900 RepID=A0AAD7WS87_9TELE|nr:hypothetical protein AAFF_G00273880 [Aldrovandia affinis]